MSKKRVITGGLFLLLLIELFWTTRWRLEPADPSPMMITPQQAISSAVNSLAPEADGYRLTNPRHQAIFNPDGVKFVAQSGPSWNWRLTLIGDEAGTALAGVVVGSVTPAAVSARVVYDRGPISEQYLAHSHHIEQQFIIPEPLDLAGSDLLITGAVASEGTFESAPGGWLWRSVDGVVSLGDVHVFDAHGKDIPARLQVTAGETRLQVDGRALAQAAYPVTIDPEIGTNDFRISDMGGDGDQAYDAFAPAVAYNEITNEYLVVWAGKDESASGPGELEIYGQLIDAATGDEVGSNDFRISVMGPDGDLAYAARTPAVTYNSTANEYLVVWAGEDNSGSLVDNESEIYGQRLNASGAEIGGNDFRISDMGPDGDTAFQALNPAVAYNSAANEYLVVWEGDDDTAPLVDGEIEIFGQRIDGATGAAAGNNDFRISDMGSDGDTAYRAGQPAVAYNSTANEYLVVWSGDDDAGGLVDEEFEIYAQRVDGNRAAADEVGSNDVRLSDMGSSDGDPTLGAFYPDVSYNPAHNEYLVVWMGDDDTGTLADNEYEIYGQRVSTNGGEVGNNDFRISQMGTADGNPAYAAYRPRVVYNSVNALYLVVWRGDDNSDSLVDDEFEIYGQEIYGNRALGDEIGAESRLSDMGNTDGDTSFYADKPAVAFSSVENAFLIVWQGDDEIGALVDDEVEVYGQRLGSDGPSAEAGSNQVADEAEVVNFSGTASDAPGEALTIEWEFGDGATASGSLTPAHTYEDDGIYTVTLEVTNSSGLSASDTLLVTVNNVAPSVMAGPDESAATGEELCLTLATFFDPGTADSHTATVNWGDGNVEAAVVDPATDTVTGCHTYNGPDAYTVTTTVTDDDGGEGNAALTITVTEDGFRILLPIVVK